MNIIENLKCKFYYKGHQIYKDGNLEEIISILKDLLENKGTKTNPSILLTLEKERIEFFIILLTGIITFYENLTKKRIEGNTINIGDIVVYNKKKYKYMGEKIIGNKRMIGLKAKDIKQQGLDCANVSYIDKKLEKEIIKYYGDSDKLGTIREKTNTLNSYKEIFLKMFDNFDETTSNIIDQQVVIVFESKRQMNDILSDYFIEIDNIKYSLEEVFPCKYYTDENRFTDIKSDITNGLLLFTSRLDVANRILITNKQCSKIVLLGENIYKDRIETTLNSIFKRLEKQKINNVIIHNTYNEINYIDRVLNKNIDCYAWSRKLIISKCNKNKSYINSYNVINKFLNYKVRNILVDDMIINNLLYHIKRGLTDIIKSEEEIYDRDSFLKVAYVRFNELQDYVYPLRLYNWNENKINEIDEIDTVLNQVLQVNSDYIFNYELLKPVVDTLNKLQDILYNKNPKIRKLKKISDSSSIIVCNNKEEKQMLLNELKLEYKNIICADELDYESEDETYIFLSDYRKTRDFQYRYASKNNIINLLNYIQAQKYNYRVRFINKQNDTIEKSNKLQSDILNSNKEDYMNLTYLKKLNNEKNIEEIESLNEDNNIKNNESDNSLDYYMEKIDYESEIDRLKSLKLNNSINISDGSYSSNCIAIKKILFEDNSYSYITSNSKIVLLDSNNKIYDNITNCKINDRALFIDEKTDNDLNLLFDNIVNSKIFKEDYEKHYENMIYWKKALLSYINTYDRSYLDIANELRIYNIKKNEQTIRGWLKSDSIIGPWKEEFYKAIGEITCDIKIMDNWKEIYESNNKIRGFRREFKKTFKNMILNSICKINYGNSELETLVNKVFGDLKEYAQIVKIIGIENIELEIPYVQANCLIYDI